MPKGKFINYTPEMLAFIKAHYAEKTDPDLTVAFNQAFNTDLSIAAIKGVRKRNKWLSGRTGQFKPGNIPHPNARPKGPNKTSFKKGEKPFNWRPVGSERINVDGYIEIKINDPNVWEFKHIIEWIKHFGPIDPGDVIRFVDGDKLNLSPSNMEKITRAEHLAFNREKVSDYAPELQPSIKLICRLKVKTHQRLNQQRR